MTDYAVFSDVHGNFLALNAVWREIVSLELNHQLILNAGDTVAYGDESAQCIDFVRAKDRIVSVGGNYDYNVAEYPVRCAAFEKKWSLSRPDKLAYIREASAQISADQRQWLAGLPKIVGLDLGGFPAALCHYSPIGKKIGLGSWTSDDELAEIAAQTDYRIIVTGHTHTPFVRLVAGTLFVNPGSVGRSWSGPTFAVISVDGSVAEAELKTL